MANPYIDDQQDNSSSQRPDSIALSNSISVSNLSHGGEESPNIRKSHGQSLEIVNINVDQNPASSTNLMKMASDNGPAHNQKKQQRGSLLTHGQVSQTSVLKDPKQTMSSNVATVVFKQDELLSGPSVESRVRRASRNKLTPSGGSSLPQDDKFSNSLGTTLRRKTTTTKRKKQRQKMSELPVFLEQGQHLECDCGICKHQLRIMKSEGIDPLVKDVIKMKERQNKFLAKQVICDNRMRALYKDITEHDLEQERAMAAGTAVLKDGIDAQMLRVQATNATQFQKGDHFSYEEQDYSWLITKLAGSNDNPYQGCLLNIPETVLFNNGKPVQVIKTSRDDNCVNYVRGGMSLNDLRKYLLSISKDRTKDYQRKLQQIKIEEQVRAKKEALEKAQQKLLRAQKSQQSYGEPPEVDVNSGRSRHKSTLSANSRGSEARTNNKNQASPSSARGGVAQTDMKQKRDTFLLRFKAGSEYLDKVIQEVNLFSELEKKASDKYWQDLSTISLTPCAKVGLGKLHTFEFVSPCFDTAKPKSRKEQIKNESMSFYGQVKFNFRQFGEDDAYLKKYKPLQYCLKMCHMIGYYLQHVHDYDLLKMKVDFNVDEFGEIWLMNVENLFVRKGRKVPTDDGSKLADFVLQHMERQSKLDEANRKLESKRKSDAMNELLISADSALEAVLKKTVGADGSNRNQNLSPRRQTISPDRSTNEMWIDPEFHAHELYKRKHPQHFVDSMLLESQEMSLVGNDMIQDCSRIEDQDPLYNSRINGSKASMTGNAVTQAKMLGQQIVSKSSYLNDADSVHKLNQLKELRLSLNKIRQGTAPADQSDRRHEFQTQQQSTIGMQKLSLDPNHQQSSYINFFANKNASTPNFDYRTQNQQQFSTQRLQNPGLAMRASVGNNQHSLKAVQQKLYEASCLQRDCTELDRKNKSKAMQQVKTTCPLLKQERVIMSVQRAAMRHQNQRKSHVYQLKSYNGEKLSTDSRQPNILSHSTQQSSIMKSTQSRYVPNKSRTSVTASGARTTNHGSKSRVTKQQNSQRESQQNSHMSSQQNDNPFKTGEAIQQYETKAAQRQLKEDLENSQSNLLFREKDMENPSLRDFVRVQAKSQSMKKILFEQQIELQKKCDFVNIQSSIETTESVEDDDKPQKEHPMKKYTKMAHQFEKKLVQDSQHFVNEYQQYQSTYERERDLNQSHQQFSTSVSLPRRKTDKKRESLNNITSVADCLSDNDQVLIDEQKSPGFHKQREASLSPDVVTILSAEDCTGMNYQKARHLAQMIVQSRDSNLIQASTRQNPVISQGLSNQPGEYSLIDATRRQHSRERSVNSGKASVQWPDTSQANQHTSQTLRKTQYNLWAYSGHSEVRSSQRRARDLKPMSNQKARALVQRDYFLSRQNNSQKLIGYPAQSDAISQQRYHQSSQNNAAFSYEGQKVRNPNQHEVHSSNTRASNLTKIMNRSGMSPFHKMQLIKGAKSSKGAPASAMKSANNITTHYGTFGAESSNNDRTRGATEAHINSASEVDVVSASFRNSISSSQQRIPKNHGHLLAHLAQPPTIVGAGDGQLPNNQRNFGNISQLTMENKPVNSIMQGYQSMSQSVQGLKNQVRASGSLSKNKVTKKNLQKASYFFQQKV